MWALFLSLLILFELIADVFAKEWSLHGHPWRWTAAILGYIIANIFWLFALKNGAGLTRGAVFFSLGSEIIAAILGLFYYHEHLSTVQFSGVLLGVVASVLIFWPEIIIIFK